MSRNKDGQIMSWNVNGTKYVNAGICIRYVPHLSESNFIDCSNDNDQLQTGLLSAL